MRRRPGPGPAVAAVGHPGTTLDPPLQQEAPRAGPDPIDRNPSLPGELLDVGGDVEGSMPGQGQAARSCSHRVRKSATARP